MKHKEIKDLLTEFSIYINNTELLESSDKITDQSIHLFIKESNSDYDPLQDADDPNSFGMDQYNKRRNNGRK